MNPIPWYKSNVLRGLVVGLVAFILKALGLAEQFPDVESYVDGFLNVVQFGAGVYAAWARMRMPNPPLTIGKPDEAPKLFAPLALALLVSLVMMPALVGCAQFAVGRAETTEQKAAALLGDFTIAQKAALVIGEDPSIPVDVRKRVINTAIEAKPYADSLDVALREYRTAKRALSSGTSTQEQIDIAARELQNWIRKLTPLVTQLRNLTEGGAT